MIKPKVKVLNIRTPQGKKLYEAIERTSGSYVTVGIQQPDLAYPGGATLGQVAAWQEFGTHDKSGRQIIPQRSFIRATVDHKFSAIEKLKDRTLAQLMAGKVTLHKALEVIGYRIVEMMRDTIVRGETDSNAPLAAKTLARKRKLGQPDTPLIATRTLLDHIGFQVQVSEHAQKIGSNDGHEGHH